MRLLWKKVVDIIVKKHYNQKENYLSFTKQRKISIQYIKKSEKMNDFQIVEKHLLAVKIKYRNTTLIFN